MRKLERSAAGIGALADDVRRELYLFVCSQPDPVSRNRAAEALGIPRHQAKFHLDKLEAAGLLEADFARLTGRTGPGAGRTAKRYHRSAGEFAVSLPGRDYELAGELMAEAISSAAHTGRPVQDALAQVAGDHGRAMAAEAAAVEEPPAAPTEEPGPTFEHAFELAIAALAEHGYEPRREGNCAVMANCPFHALAESHTELVCEMNHALLTGMASTLAPGVLEARLEPQEGRCCVVLGPPAAADVPDEAQPQPSSSGTSAPSASTKTRS